MKSPPPTRGAVLGRGHYRTVRTNSSFVARKRQRNTQFSGSLLHLPFPASWRVFIRMGSGSTNQRELDNYEKYFSRAPHMFRKSFPVVFGIDSKTKELVVEKVTDYTGKVSRTLQQHGPISDPHFWNRFREIIQWMNARKIYLLDLAPHNIVVRYTRKGECVPAFIDYKSVGIRHNLTHFWRVIPGVLPRLMSARALNLEEQYGGLLGDAQER